MPRTLCHLDAMPEAAVAEAKKVHLSSDEQAWSRTTSGLLAK